MKYLNGGWMIRDGFQVEYANMIYDVKIEKKKVTLYCPLKEVKDKGQTLDGGMITIEISAPAEDSFKIRQYHYKGTKNLGPHFSVHEELLDLKVKQTDEVLIIQNSNAKIKCVFGSPMSMYFYYKDELITSSLDRSKAIVIDDQKEAHSAEQLTLGIREKIYGLGERFGNFVKNGQSIEIWNEDGGTGTEQAYKNIPFYISNKNYGLFVNDPGKVEFEIGSEKVSRIQFSVPGQSLEYVLFFADDMKGVLNAYTKMTGRPSLPPLWSSGLWLSTSFLTNYDEQTVLSFVDGMKEKGIPLEVFHFDCLWMKEYEWCNFTFDERTFPDPKGLLKKLHERGLKVCVWINPYIGQKSPLFDEGMDKGYFIKRINGDVWQWDKWQAGLAIVDFTNPNAVKWYTDHLKKLLDLGVDCFKTDFGERIPTDAVYFDGCDPYKMHNYYAYLYNKIVYDFLVKEKGQDNAVLFARSASVGSQQFPVHWGGDCSSDYLSMAESLRAGLSFGLSGFGYWSHDISGFENGATSDLYKRWTQFGLLSSHSRYHGSWEYKVPWLYGEEAVEVTRAFTKLKLSLMPYLQNASVIASKQGLPVLRAMVLEFESDPNVFEIDTQYMLGPDLLVAPIFNEEGLATFYVPEGVWTDLLTNETYGPGWYTKRYDYFHLPLLVRQNSILVMKKDTESAMYDQKSVFEVHIYEPQTNNHTVIYDQKGQEIGSVSFVKEKGRVNVSEKGCRIENIFIHENGLTVQI